MSKYIVDILDKDKYALEIGITKNGSPASQRVLDAVKVGIPYVERPRGEWKIYVNSGGTLMRLCMRCGHEFNDNSDAKNFCPNCGADMRKEGEANENMR